MNKPTYILLRYEWKVFKRNKFQLLLLGITFVFGLYAIYYGQSEINTQRDTISAVTALEKDEFSQYKASFKEELETLEQEQTHDIASRPAYAWYRHGYHAILHPHDFAPLSIGQRDLFRYYYRLTGMSLHYQLFENEIANPVNLMVGNFDLSFVIVYLFPLLIIAFCYGLFSIEKENGTLPLLLIQAISIQKIIIIRLAFYFVLITGLGLLISLSGLFSSGNLFATNNHLPAISWLMSVVTYCAFWFGLIFLIISFRKNSAFNAITAVGSWLLLIIIIPSLLNVIVTIKYPLNSVTLADLTRRTGLENENDEEESRQVIMEFIAHKPELSGSENMINNNIMAKAYAAFTSLKDINNQAKVDHYNAQVAKRNTWTSQFYWLSPPVSMQDVFAHIAHTDLHTFLYYQDALAIFHEEITDFYFSRLFRDKPILLEDYNSLPTFKIIPYEGRWNQVWWGIGRATLLALIIFAIGHFNIQRRYV